MKTLIAFALVASSLASQTRLDPNIILQAGQPQVQIVPPWVAAEAAGRVRLMQEQARMLEAQRKALEQQGGNEQKYKEGFEDGLKKGFEAGKEAAYKDFKDNYQIIEANAVRGLANAVFNLEGADNFRSLIDQVEAALAKDPNDNLRKALLVLYRHRLSELQPTPVKKQVKPKK